MTGWYFAGVLWLLGGFTLDINGAALLRPAKYTTGHRIALYTMWPVLAVWALLPYLATRWSLLILLGLALAVALPAWGAGKDENYWNTKMCNVFHGEKEYPLDDRTRVDCLTKHWAIETDWAYKWAECVGQSQKYAQHTGQHAGCVVLLKESADMRFITRLRTSYEYGERPYAIWYIETWKPFKVRKLQ